MQRQGALWQYFTRHFKCDQGCHILIVIFYDCLELKDLDRSMVSRIESDISPYLPHPSHLFLTLTRHDVNVLLIFMTVL